MLLSAGFDLSFMDMIIKDAVESVLYITTAYNKGGGHDKYKHCPNLTSVWLFLNRNSSLYLLMTIANKTFYQYIIFYKCGSPVYVKV